MLASITPLGEWSRNSRWGVTVTAFVAGSTSAGLAAGATLGAVGVFLRAAASPSVRLWILAALLVAAMAFATVLPARRVRSPAALVSLDGRLRRWDRPSHALTAASLAVLAAVATVAAWR